MVSSWINLRVSGLEDFDRAASSIEYVEREFPKWVRRDIEDSANSIKDNARRRIMEEATHGLKHTGLRASIAAGVSVVSVSDDTGSGSAVVTTVPNANEAPIPRGFDFGLQARGWRHPVFGNKKKWVSQRGDISWFSDSVNEEKPILEEKVKGAMEDAALWIKTS